MKQSRAVSGVRRLPSLESGSIIDWVTNGLSAAHEFKLFDDVGQIYEAELARMEFLPFKDELDLFLKRTAYFEEVDGEKTHHYYISSVKGKGQIGHSNQYMTHWFYPYKGKFHGQMVKALINFMDARQGDVILDPFVGSGTTLVEAKLLSVDSVGIDINPACCFISQVKTDSLDLTTEALDRVLSTYRTNQIFEHFHNVVLKTETALSEADLNKPSDVLLDNILTSAIRTSDLEVDPLVRNFLLVCYMHALSDYTYLRSTQKAQPLPAFFKRDLQEYRDTIAGTESIHSKLDLTFGKVDVRLGNALNLPLEDSTIHGIVTSPPYSIALDYIKNDAHLLGYLGINPYPLRNKMVGLRGRGDTKLTYYAVDMRSALAEMYRVLKPGCYAAIVLGDVTVEGKRTAFHRAIQRDARRIGFSNSHLILRPILGGYARLRHEYIILLQK